MGDRVVSQLACKSFAGLKYYELDFVKYVGTYLITHDNALIYRF